MSKIWFFNSSSASIPQQLGAILYIPDFNMPVNGYWQDKSGKGKLVQAATTTVANDSLIMPANDADIIAALTLAGAYSKYYTNNSTPKKVLVSQIASIDSKYCVFFDAKTKTKFSLFKTQGDEARADKMYEFTFKAYTGGYFPITQTSDSISIILKGSGMHIFDWDDGSTNSYTLTGSSQTISHTYTTNIGGQKNIRVTGDVSKWTYIDSQTAAFCLRTSKMLLTYVDLRGTNMCCGVVTDGNLTNCTIASTASYCTGLITNKPIITINITGQIVLDGDIGTCTSLYYISDSSKSVYYGKLDNLINLAVAYQFSPSSKIDKPVTFINLTKLATILMPSYMTFTSTEINKYLADLVSNMSISRPLAVRNIDIRGSVNSGGPSGQGLTDKAALQSTVTPVATVAWTILTRSILVLFTLSQVVPIDIILDINSYIV